MGHRGKRWRAPAGARARRVRRWTRRRLTAKDHPAHRACPVTIGWCCRSPLRPAPPTSPGWPRTGSTCWSSGAGSPASASPWTPRRAACRWPWWRRTTSRPGPRGAPPGWCTAGLRYLEHGEFGLVRESLRERGILFRLAPHLVRPVPMYMLADDLRSRATYRVGLTGYELLAAGRNIGYHRSVSAGQVRAAIPGLGARPRGFRYFECQVDDARLTIEVARTAQAAGARLANHARVSGLLGDGRVTGAVVTDEMTGQRFEVRARAVVNAAGVWADQVTRLAGAGLAGAGLAGAGLAGAGLAGAGRRAAAAEQGRAPGVRPGGDPDHGGAGRAVGGGRRAVHLHRPVGGPGVRRDDRQPLYGRPGSPGGRRGRP